MKEGEKVTCVLDYSISYRGKSVLIVPSGKELTLSSIQPVSYPYNYNVIIDFPGGSQSTIMVDSDHFKSKSQMRDIKIEKILEQTYL